MKLKSMFPVSCLLFLLCVSAPLRLNAAADPTALYTAGQVQVEAIGFADTEDLKEIDYGGGVAVTWWHWAQAGLGFEGRLIDTHHSAFDTVGLNLAARFPSEKLGAALITRVGFDWQSEQVNNPRANEFDVYVGIGLEKRIGAYSIGAEVRGVRAAELKPDERLLGLIRIGRTF